LPLFLPPKQSISPRALSQVAAAAQNALHAVDTTTNQRTSQELGMKAAIIIFPDPKHGGDAVHRF
jgi:hypothetical protein